MTPTTSSEARTRFWQEQIDAWQASNLSQQAFCKTHNLNYPRFGYWLRKFRRQDTPHRSGFVPVVGAAPSSGLSLRLPNGLELRGIDTHNVALVTQLIDRLS